MSSRINVWAALFTVRTPSLPTPSPPKIIPRRLSDVPLTSKPRALSPPPAVGASAASKAQLRRRRTTSLLTFISETHDGYLAMSTTCYCGLRGRLAACLLACVSSSFKAWTAVFTVHKLCLITSFLSQWQYSRLLYTIPTPSDAPRRSS